MATTDRTSDRGICKTCDARSMCSDVDSVSCCTQCRRDVFGNDGSQDRCDGSIKSAAGDDEIRIKLHACTCGNDDVNEFEFRTQGGACSLICRLCGRVYMTSSAAAPAENQSDRDIGVDAGASVVDEVVGITSVDGVLTSSKADEVGLYRDWPSARLDDGMVYGACEDIENVPAVISQPEDRQRAAVDTSLRSTGVMRSTLSYLGRAAWAMWSYGYNAPLIRKEAAIIQSKVLAQIETNVITNKPVADGVQAYVIEGMFHVGQTLLINLGGSVGQKLLLQSPTDGLRLGVFVASQLAQWLHSRSYTATKSTEQTTDKE